MQERRCRLLLVTAILAQHQKHAFFSDGPNIREHAKNDLASCKTSQPIAENKIPRATAIATGAEDVVVSVYLSGKHIAVFVCLAMPSASMCDIDYQIIDHRRPEIGGVAGYVFWRQSELVGLVT
jgi:hypothetical protein